MDATQSPWKLAALTGGITFAWYALPDAVRSRGMRVLTKAALLAGTGAVASRVVADQADSLPDPAALPAPTPALVAGGAALLAAGTALTVWGEKAVFAFGERRRARGVRFAHTLPALLLAGVAAATCVLESPER